MKRVRFSVSTPASGEPKSDWGAGLRFHENQLVPGEQVERAHAGARTVVAGHNGLAAGVQVTVGQVLVEVAAPRPRAHPAWKRHGSTETRAILNHIRGLSGMNPPVVIYPTSGLCVHPFAAICVYRLMARF